MSFQILLAVFGSLLLICLFANKFSYISGIPSLLVFMSVGMLAGTDGLGGIAFEDARLTNYIGTVSLAFILFSGGLNTDWKSVAPVLFRGSILATLGVALTAFFTYLCAHYLVRLPKDISLLLGVILSSTDAAAVFTALRSSGMTLKSEKLQALLEFESGSNDPMAVILSVGAIGVLTTKTFSFELSAADFIMQMGVGIFCGYFFGRICLFVLKHYDFIQRGLYPVFGVSVVFLIFSVTQMLDGNGYLALYLSGILLGNKTYRYRKPFVEFNDSLAWIMQIVMFLALGLLVNPRQLGTVFFPSVWLSVCLMFVARPLAVWLCLYKSGYTLKEQSFVFWAGLKGAVPIILATFPLMINYPNSQYLFNLIFFLVVISVLIQGKTLPILAKKLDLVGEEVKQPDPDEEGIHLGEILSAREDVIVFLSEIRDELLWFFGKIHNRGQQAVSQTVEFFRAYKNRREAKVPEGEEKTVVKEPSHRLKAFLDEYKNKKAVKRAAAAEKNAAGKKQAPDGDKRRLKVFLNNLKNKKAAKRGGKSAAKVVDQSPAADEDKADTGK